MKLWEYVLKYDKRGDFIKYICEYKLIDGSFVKYDLPMPYELFIKRDYCPGAFECFENTAYQNPMYPYTKKKKEDLCKFFENDSFYIDEKYHGSEEKMFKNFYKQRIKCSQCWDREIADKNDINNTNDEEYQLYLKLKEKFKTGD